MKNMEKIIPAVAVSLAVAGVGGADALATELDTTAQVPAETPEVTPAAANTMDTQIHTLTESGTEETKETKEAEETEEAAQDAGKKLDANLSVDINGDGTVDATFNGQLSADTTPQPPVTDPVTGDVTNTENTNINGSIGATIPGTPFAEDQDAVDNTVEENTNTDSLTGEKTFDKDGFQAAIKEQFGEDIEFKPTQDETGKENGFTFETSKTVDKPLSDAEKDTILAASGITRNAAGQYVNAAGTAVNVNWGEDRSTVTNTTTWTVTVTEIPAQEESGTENIGGDKGSVTIPDSSAGGQTADALIEGILADAENNPNKYTVDASEDGNTTTVTVKGDNGQDAARYVITVTETDLTQEELNAVDNATLVKLLGEDKYELNADGKIVTRDGGYEVTVTNGLTGGKTILKTLTVTNLQYGESSNSTMTGDEIADAKQEVMTQAVSDAVAKALEAEDAKDYWVDQTEGKKPVYDEATSTWTVVVHATVGGVEKEFTFKVKGTATDDGGIDWKTEKDIVTGDYVDGSGKEHTIKGEGFVTGETITWGGDKEYTETGKDYITVDGATKEVKVNIEEKDNKKYLDGWEVLGDISETTDANGNKVITVKTQKPDDVNVTKEYTFTFSTATTEEAKAALGDLAAGADTVEGLTKVSWTMTETTVTPPTDGGFVEDETFTEVEVELPNGGNTTITKDNQGNYKYGDVTFIQAKDEHGNDIKDTYTGVKGDVTYTIVEEKVDLTEKQDVLDLLAQKGYTEAIYGTAEVDFTEQAVTFTKTDGSKFKVSFEGAKKTVVKLTSKAEHHFQEEGTVDGTNKDDVTNQINAKKAAFISQVQKWIAEQKKQGITQKIGDRDLSTMSSEDLYDFLDSWIVTSVPDFSELGPDQIIPYLEKLQRETSNEGTVNRRDHLDLDLGGTLTLTDSEGNIHDDVKYEIVKVDDFWISNDASGLFNNDHFSHSVGTSKVWDGGNGYWEYRGATNNGIKNSFKGKNFYKVTGRIKYNFEGTWKEVDLLAYGYFNDSGNTCENMQKGWRGYDLVLDNLTLVNNGETVVAGGRGTYSFDRNVIIDSDYGVFDMGSKLTINGIYNYVAGTDESFDTTATADGDVYGGAWSATQEKDVTKEGSYEGDPDRDRWQYAASAETQYDTWREWVEGQAQTLGSSTATEYAGTLGYSYVTSPADVSVEVSGETNANRNIDADVTTSTVTPGTTTPTTPDEGGGGGGTGGGTGGDTTIDDGETPLAELPDEEVPLAELPEEAEEDEVEIPDDEVPLAEVPMTGDISPLWTLAAALSVGGLSVLSMLRKKRRG